MKILRWSLLSLAIAFLVVPTLATPEPPRPDPGIEGDLPALGDIDGDGIQNSLDICVWDDQNDCEEARACKKLDESIEKSHTIGNIFEWIAWITGIVAVILGLIATGFTTLPGAFSILLGIKTAVFGLLSLATGWGAGKLHEAMAESGCLTKHGWR